MRRALAGMLLPGLGHLLSGRVLEGLGLLAILATLLWAAATGGPRLESLLRPPGTPLFLIHPWAASSGWLVATILVWHRAWRFYKGTAQRSDDALARNQAATLGLYMVLWIVLVSVLAPLIAPFDPDQLEVGPKLAPPGLLHWMGTDELRRDILSRVLYGGRVSLSIGLVAVLVSTVVGTAVGAVAAHQGGWVDRGLMWFTDLLHSPPRLVLLLATTGLFRAAGVQTMFLVIAVLGLTGWMGIARTVRSQLLSLQEQEFVQASRALGLPASRILSRHIGPNALAPVLAHALLGIGPTILTEAGLSFIGLGAPPPTATWGGLVGDGREYLHTAWWIAVFPGLAIVFTAVGFNLLADGLRDALAPSLRR